MNNHLPNRFPECGLYPQPKSTGNNLKKIISALALGALIALPQLGFSQATVTDPALNDPNYQANKQSQAKLSGKNLDFTPITQSTSAARTAATSGEEFADPAGTASALNSSCFIPRDGSYTPVPRNDDGSYGPIALGFAFNLYGTFYSQVWINTNGNLTFNGPISTYNPSGFPYHVPMVAGFWGDVDTNNGGQIYFKQSAGNIIVTWDAVRAYPSTGSAVNTFQIILTNGTDPLLGLGRNVALNHQNIQWAYGSASTGSLATVGINHGNGSNYVQVGRFLHNNYSYDGPGGNHDGLYYLNGLCSNFNVSNAGNIEPSSSNFPANNTVTLNVGQTVNLNPQFIGPEVDQTVTTTVNTNGMCGVTSSVSNGSVSSINLAITGSACNVGTNTITFTATDNGTPAKTTVETITVNIISPCNTVLSATSTNVACAGASNGSVNLNVSGGTAPFSYSWSNGATTEDLANVPAGTYNVTVTDANNCTATTSVSVGTQQDNTNPTITAPTALTINGCSASGVNLGTPVTADNCTVASVTNNAPATFSQGTTTVTWTVTDASGNTATATQTVTVTDNQNPTIAAPHNQIIDLNNTCSVALPDYRTQLLGLSDNCTPNNALVVTQSPAPGTMVSGTGNITVSFTAQDAAGNIGTASFTVTKRDIIAPVVATKNYTVQLGANGQGTVTTANVNNNSSDNCSPVDLTFSNSGVVCGIANEGDVLTLTAPAGAVFTSINFASYGTAAGNCGSFTQGWCHAANSNSVVANALIGKNSGSIAANNNVFGDPCFGTFKRLVVQATYSIQGISANGNSITFNCSQKGNNTVTLIGTDASGNVSSQTAIVTVVDNVAPIVVTKDITVQLDANGNGSVTATQVNNGSSDNCGIALTTVSPATFTCANVGDNTVTLTVTDVHGNSSTATATVTVEDNVAPVVATQTVTVQLNANGTGSVTAAQVNNGSADACGIATMALDVTDFTCANVGNNTVTLTVTDVNGNVSTGTATVVVQDNVAPVAMAQNMTIQLDANGNASVTAAQIDNGSADACGIASLALSKTDFDCSNIGANTVTLTVTDNNGNISTATAIVTVEDKVAPVAAARNVEVTLVNGTASISTADVDNGSSDACGIASLALDKTTFSCEELGKNTVTLTVTDVNGNVSSTTATVNVIGVTPTPEIAVTRYGSNINTGADAYTIFMGYGNQAVTLTASNATSAANATTYSWSPAAGLSNATSANPVFTPTAGGSYTFNVTATNEFGCTATTWVTVKVVDARCGNKMDKVLVCHKGTEICISANAVPAHLAHGCSVGACGSATARGAQLTETAKLEAYPNPFSDRTNLEFSITQDSRFRLEVLDIKGSLVKVMAEGNAKAGKLQAYEFNAGNLSEGIYIVRLVTETEVKHVKMILKH